MERGHLHLYRIDDGGNTPPRVSPTLPTGIRRHGRGGPDPHPYHREQGDRDARPGAGLALSDSEHVDVTVRNSPITDNVPENCFPVTEVPTCVNTVRGSEQRP
jgi:hypothetical protein